MSIEGLTDALRARIRISDLTIQIEKCNSNIELKELNQELAKNEQILKIFRLKNAEFFI